MKFKVSKSLLLTLIAISAQVQADCEPNRSDDSTTDGNAAVIQAGRINMGSEYLQPVGTVLASTVISPTESVRSLAETILMTCDFADRDQIYELFATNADDRVGGFWEIGNGSGAQTNDGMPGYFATWFPYLALKATHLNSGKVVTRFWQKAPLNNYDVSEDGTQIYVRTKHLSQYQVELARVSTQYAPTGSRSNYCGGNPSFGSTTVRTYTCGQPNFYVQLGGPGINSSYADEEGEDAAFNYDFFGDNGVAFRLRNGLTMSYFPTCIIRNHTPVVLFPTMSAQAMEDGETAQAPINISIECEDTVESGTSTLQTAMGFMVNSQADIAAVNNGLVNGGGVTYLLSDGYETDSSIAQNVGLRMWDVNGSNIPFVRANGAQFGSPSGRSAGWIPVLENANFQGSEFTNHSSYNQEFMVTLEKIEGSSPVTAGKVKAQARIIIKVQ